MTTGKNPAYPRINEHCYLIGGTHGSLSRRGRAAHLQWRTRLAYPFDRQCTGIVSKDQLPRQVRSPSLRVIPGLEPPAVSGRDGLNTLLVLEAVKDFIFGGERITV